MKFISKVITVFLSTIMFFSCLTTNVVCGDETGELYFINNIDAYNKGETVEYRNEDISICAGDIDLLFVYVDSSGNETNVSHGVEFSSTIENITNNKGSIDFGNGPINVLSLDVPATGTATVTYAGKELTLNFVYPGFFAKDKDGRIRQHFNLEVDAEIQFDLFYDNKGTLAEVDQSKLTTSGDACTYSNGTLTAVKSGEFRFIYPNPFNTEDPFSLCIDVQPEGGQEGPNKPQYTDYDSSKHKGDKLHATTQSEFENAITSLAEAEGGVIYIDGAIPEGGTDKVLKLDKDITIYHKYPDNLNSQGSTDLSHSSYEDFLLIDLQCDIVTNGTIIINGYHGQSDPKNYKTYNANVLINGNGHSITSTALKTLSTSYGANITVANTKIINSNEQSVNAAAVEMAAGTFTADEKVELKGPIGLHVVPADMSDASSQASSINIEGKVIGTKNAGFVVDGVDAYTKGQDEQATTAYRNAWFFGTINHLETNIVGYAAIVKGNDESQLDVGNSNGGIYLANGRLNVFGAINSNSDCIVIDKDLNLIGDTNTFVNVSNNATLNSANGSCIKELTQSDSNIKQIKITGGSFACNASEEIISLSSGVTITGNNIDITGGKYSKKFADKYKKSNTKWEEQDDKWLLVDNSGELLEIADLASLKKAISNGNTNLKLTNSIILDEEIEIPYQINIDLNNNTITGGCLYFNAPQIIGASLNDESKSKLSNGYLVATTKPIVKTNGLLILKDANVSKDTNYNDYLLSVVKDGLLDLNNCNITGNKGIDLNLFRLFDRNSTELNIVDSKIDTIDTAINAKGETATPYGVAYPEFTIAISQGTEITSSNTAVKADTVKVLVFGATITGKTCIDTNYAIDLDQKATLLSIKPQGDTSENAAIIINGPREGRIAYYTDNESSLVSSDYDYAMILKGKIGDFEIKHGNYSGHAGVINTTNLTEHSDIFLFDRGRLSHDIDDSYIPSGFECIKVDTSNMPYAVVRKYDSKVIGDYTVQPYLLDELSTDVTLDSNALASALGSSISSDATLIFSATEEDVSKVEQLTQTLANVGDIVDCYDLHIDQKLSDTEFNKLSTVDSLQTISIPLSDEAKNNKDDLVIYHENNVMDLVTKEAGASATSECAYIDNDVLVIKTKTFSSFSVVNAEKTAPEYTAPIIADDSTYTGNEISLIKTNGQSQHGIFKYAYVLKDDTAPTTYSDSISVVDAGSYDVYFMLEGDGRHFDIDGTKLGTVTINKKVIDTVENPASSTIDYGQKLSSSTLNPDTWNWVDGDVIPVVNNDGYNVVLNVADDNNNDYSSVEGYNASTKTITRKVGIKVNKSSATVTNPTAMSDLVYVETSGTPVAQNLINAGQSQHGTFKYALANPSNEGDIPTDEAFTTTIPQGTSAGTYYVYYKLFGDANHIDGEKSLLTVTIAKATPSQITTGVASRITYGSTLAASTLTNDWKWVNEAKVPDVNNTGYDAYHEVDGANYDYSKVSGYDSSNHRITRKIYIVVDKADKTVIDSDIPSNIEADSGTKLKNISLDSGWSWVDGEQEVGSSNLAKYVDPSGNYNDVIVNIPISVKRMLSILGGKNNVVVKIKNKVSTTEPTNIKKNDVSIKNDVLTETLIDILTNKNSKVVISNPTIISDIIGAGSVGTIDVNTEFKSEETEDNGVKERIKSFIGQSNQGLSRLLDLSISLSVKLDDVDAGSALITELSSPIKVSIKLSNDEPVKASTGKTLKYYLIRLHDNGNGTFETTKIPATLNPWDKTITADIDKFSVFGIYHEEVEENNDAPSSNGGHNAYVAPKTGVR